MPTRIRELLGRVRWLRVGVKFLRDLIAGGLVTSALMWGSDNAGLIATTFDLEAVQVTAFMATGIGVVRTVQDLLTPDRE